MLNGNDNTISQTTTMETKLNSVADGNRKDSPVFILSPAPRSGTNYLAHILLLNPDFQLPNLLWEDYMLMYSHLLEQYTSQTSKRWSKKIRENDDYQKSLLEHLGGGILSFLYKQVENNKRLLCKTPRAHNISNFFLLFPQAKLLILIRDGRDVVESAVRTWPKRILAFERSAYTWARGARQVIEFMQGSGRDLRGKSWKIIKYEDLIQNPETILINLLDFLDIHADTFDMAQFKKMPLWGSSIYHGPKSEVHWEPVDKPRDFKPIGKWGNWDYWHKSTFKMIAGQELVRLGYVYSNDW